MRENRFQIEVATGRFTLPVVTLVCLLLWGISFNQWDELVSLAIVASIGYLMIEANTHFSLIRTRTTMPVSLYVIMATVLFFLHPFQWSLVVPLLFMMAIFQMFLSYESPRASTPIYHSFLFLSIGSLIFPHIIYFMPLFLVGMIPFRAMSLKSFAASLLGMITPYWFLFGYAFLTEQTALWKEPLQEMITFHPIDFSHLALNEKISGGVTTLLLIVGAFHYWQRSYTDRTQTRIYHSFLAYTGLWATLFGILQPHHFTVWLQIQLICSAFLNGHLFTLTRNRFTGIYFMITFAALTILMIYNLWMLFFSF